MKTNSQILKLQQFCAATKRICKYLHTGWLPASKFKVKWASVAQCLQMEFLRKWAVIWSLHTTTRPDPGLLLYLLNINCSWVAQWLQIGGAIIPVICDIIYFDTDFSVINHQAGQARLYHTQKRSQYLNIFLSYQILLLMCAACILSCTDCLPDNCIRHTADICWRSQINKIAKSIKSIRTTFIDLLISDHIQYRKWLHFFF